MKNIFSILSIFTLFIFSCENDFENDVTDVVVTSGSADFTTYVALGNSLTSGYADGALYSSAQQNSFPAILAGQFSLAGGGNFTQPLMPNDIGGFANLGLPGKLTLQNVNGRLAPVPSMAGGDLDFINGTYNNMGIPGAKSFHLVTPGYAALNPYFTRFASSPTTTVLGDAAAQNATFFSLWIGNNDVLSYSTTGGVGTNQMAEENINPSSYGINDISHPTVVAGSIQNILNAMTTNGAKGVIANIPEVTSIPFFTTVPYNPLAPETLGVDNINALNQQLYGPLSQILTAIGQGDRISPLSTTEDNPVLIVDETLTNVSTTLIGALQMAGMSAQEATVIGTIFGQARQATENDLILLTTSGVIGNEYTANDPVLMIPPPAPVNVAGVSYPLQDQHVLTQDEVSQVSAATAAYNAAIESLANTYDLALFDANAAMSQLSTESGILYNGVTYTSTFVSGGAFSLDGVHPNARGYAIISNLIIDAINDKYGSTLPWVDPNSYPGISIPHE